MKRYIVVVCVLTFQYVDAGTCEQFSNKKHLQLGTINTQTWVNYKLLYLDLI